MTGRTFNFRSPVGVALSVLAGILLLIITFVTLDGLGFRFDPFDLSAKRLATAEQQRDLAQQDASARRIEKAGTVETLRRVEQVTLQIRAAEQIAFQSATDAAEAPDAKTPVDILTVLSACALLTTACAISALPSVPRPPLRPIPDQVLKPCHLPRLPDGAATIGDLETLLVQRGTALLACDASRQLAVDTLIGQQTDLKALGQGE